MRRSVTHSKLRPRFGLRRLHVSAGRTSAGTLAPPVQLRLLLRWSARATSAFAVAMLLGGVFATGLDPAALAPREWILMLFFLWTAVGMVLAWRWEARGATLSLAGLVGFHLVEWAGSGSWPRGWAFPALAVPGLLFLASAWCGRRLRPDACA